MATGGAEDKEAEIRITCHNEECICQGKCCLSEPDYYENYRKLVDSFVSHLDWPDVELQILYGKAFDFYDPREHPDEDLYLEIFDRKLDEKNYGIVITPIDDPDLRECVIEDFVYDLAEQEDHLLSGQFTPHDHLLLWCAVLSCNMEMLAKTLEKTKGQIPSCVLQSLLLRAIHVRSIEAVTILLQNGAVANRVLRMDEEGGYACNENRPISACVKEMESKEASEEDLSVLDEILRLLFSHCDDQSVFTPTPFYLDDDWYTLVMTCHLWKRSPQTAEFLLERGAKYLNLDEHSPIDAHLTTIETLFTFFAHMGPVLAGNPNPPFPTLVFAEMFHYGILQLLRAGARMFPPFEKHFKKRYAKLYRQLKKTGPTEISQIIWGRDDAFLDIMFESRPYDVKKLNIWRLGDSEASEVVLDRLPFRLQSAARRAILKCLPLGFRSREDAIESLDLPKILQDYLRFKELDVLPQSLEEPVNMAD